MDERTISAIQTLVTACVPAVVTVITYLQQSRQAKKHAAKQSILQMIMEDQLNWELFRKFPVNYGNIQNEYEVYHENGGNGEVTKKVRGYNKWYELNEDSMLQHRDYSCGVELVHNCTKNGVCSVSETRTNAQ